MPPYLPSTIRISGVIEQIEIYGQDSIIVSSHWGIYHCSINTRGEGFWQSPDSESESSIMDISIVEENDYFLISKHTESIHFNGLQYQNMSIPSSNWANASDIKNDFMVVVTESGKVIRGYR